MSQQEFSVNFQGQNYIIGDSYITATDLEVDANTTNLMFLMALAHLAPNTRNNRLRPLRNSIRNAAGLIRRPQLVSRLLNQSRFERFRAQLFIRQRLKWRTIAKANRLWNLIRTRNHFNFTFYSDGNAKVSSGASFIDLSSPTDNVLIYFFTVGTPYSDLRAAILPPSADTQNNNAQQGN